jgi:uncharacterized protein (TIGR02145 family)
VVWGTSSTPTVALSTKTTNGTGTGSFTSTLTSLTGTTTYYVRAYATNSVGTAYGNEVSFTTTAPCTSPTVLDVDGNSYNTVSIGSQCWTQSNLRVSKYNDGTDINLDASGGSTGTTSQTWTARTTGAYTIYANETITGTNATTYGFLYNWYALTDSKKLCPSGWHVPTDEEFTLLIQALDPSAIPSDNGQQGNNVGSKLKQTGTSLWSDNADATNVSGFTALPGGFRSGGGSFISIRNIAFFWSTSEDVINSSESFCGAPERRQ